MGAYGTKFRQEGQTPSLANSHPNRADWITSHAVETKLAIVEVERLWKRFQQLGSNADGELTGDVLSKPVAKEDIFSQNILTILRGDNGKITFLTFLNCMNWAESSPFDQKVIAAFQLLNNGQPITRDIFFKIISRIYQDESMESKNRLTDILMNQLGGTSSGRVTQQQFLERVKALPQETTAKLFKFLIVPHEINEEAHRAFTSLSKNALGRGQSAIPEEPDISRQIPSDGILQQIADRIHRRDWPILANKLSFTDFDIRDFEMRSDQSTDQVFEMLKAWRHREGTGAYCEVLERALHDSNFGDAALLLYP